MKTHTHQFREADDRFKAAAYLNAREMNAINSFHWSDSQKARAFRMKHALELVYQGSVFLNYRKTKISLKCSGGVVDKKNLALLEAQWAAAGVVKAVTPQGILYSFAQ